MDSSYSATIASLGKLIAGLQLHPLPGVLVVDGTTYTTAELVQALQSTLDALNAAVSARATYLDSTKKANASLVGDRPLMRGLKDTLLTAYGTSAVLADFGLPPRKTPVVSLETRLAASAKARATREARGTKGAKQKAKITGNVTGVTITPVTTPVASAPAPPAPSPAGAPGATHA